MWPDDSKATNQHSLNRVEIVEHQADDGVDSTLAMLNRISEWRKIVDFAQTLLRSRNSSDQIPLADTRRQARFAVIKAIQRKYYGDELQSLRRNQTVSKGSKLRNLCPEIDQDGILRVGGRLNNSLLPHEGKHPIILPGAEPLVRKLIRRTHCMEGHVGRNHVISSLREQYWITGMTTAVRKVLNDCVYCKKYQARLETQKMGNLPMDRISATRAFENSGVDYFGPLRVKVGYNYQKRYGVLFSCNYTRAIHLEVSRTMDAQSCLMAISRFMNRRGRPKKLRSDNGTNLVGACKEMKQNLLKMNKQLQIEGKLAKEEIEWTFNPPQASHFGGHYERQIRSVRKILYGLVNRQTLTEEELQTVMVKAEWIMNSRPLTSTSSSDKSVVAITPNQLMGLNTVETDTSLTEEGDLYRGRWRRVNYVTEQFWKQFNRLYVTTLQQRHKWQDPKAGLKENDIVVVQDNSVGRAYWPVGRIIKIDPSRDRRARSCQVKTQNGIYARPITKLARLIQAED